MDTHRCDSTEPGNTCTDDEDFALCREEGCDGCARLEVLRGVRPRSREEFGEMGVYETARACSRCRHRGSSKVIVYTSLTIEVQS